MVGRGRGELSGVLCAVASDGLWWEVQPVLVARVQAMPDDSGRRVYRMAGGGPVRRVRLLLGMCTAASTVWGVGDGSMWGGGEGVTGGDDGREELSTAAAGVGVAGGGRGGRGKVYRVDWTVTAVVWGRNDEWNCGVGFDYTADMWRIKQYRCCSIID
jgi:hypothetical protein